MPVRLRLRRLTAPSFAVALTALLVACGGGAAPASAPSVAESPAAHTATHISAALRDWPEFGLDPQRSDATNASTGITAANVAHLRRITVNLPGTVDSSPIYLHGVSVAGAVRNVAVITTTYGKTLAVDADSGRSLWTFTPPGYSHWAGSAQITTTTPLADPDRRWVYAASPNGLIYKLSLADGSPAGGAAGAGAAGAGASGGGWPVSVTREPLHEKLGAALNIDGPYLLVATGGYYGDAPPYQGHVVAITRTDGRVAAVFNTLCANRRHIQVPRTCAASDSAVLSRGGPVVEAEAGSDAPGRRHASGGRILVDTGNGPWNGTTNFGDSALELAVPGLRLRQAYTPVDQEHLNTSDTDLGSSAPALLGDNRVVVAGKDGIMRVLALSRLDGHAPDGRYTTLGGEVQQLPTPESAELFTAPSVWHHGRQTTVFVADFSATAAYALRGGRLRQLWLSHYAGTSPIVAGGLVYVYEPSGGGIEVYNPSSSRPIAKLPGSPGHWNSPIVMDGHVVEPEGDANSHQLSGTLDLFSAS